MDPVKKQLLFRGQIMPRRFLFGDPRTDDHLSVIEGEDIGRPRLPEPFNMQRRHGSRRDQGELNARR